jgi:putative NIF3 family GTP cyclohydrolase 1 type 2
MKNLSLISAFLIVFLCTVTLNGQNTASGQTTSAKDVISLIIKNTGSGLIPGTVDVIKEGNPETVVTGIITCMFATMDVLKQAVAKNCNLIIVHEPLYYNHLDDTKQFQNDSVYLSKSRFIKEHQLVIWRFHDYIHSMKPDGIMSGMVIKLGWKEYLADGRQDQFNLPETTLKELLASLKKVFPENAFYVVGNPDMKLSKVKLAPGAPGSSYHIRLLEDKNIDVVIGGESPQWETYEYMRDAVSQGRKKAVIFLGHISSEESGMDYCAGWLKGFIKDIPVSYVRSGPSYWSY